MPEVAALRRFRGDGIEIDERPPRACVDVRGNADDDRFVRAVQSITDLAVPRRPSASATGLLAALLWLGPDEWLVTSEAEDGAALAGRLQAALRGVAAAAIDVSHARIVYAVAGVNARDVLAKGCSLDLHERVFAAGRCAQTVLAKVSVILHQTSTEPVFELYVARSVADYAWRWLQLAAAEHAIAADPSSSATC